MDASPPIKPPRGVKTSKETSSVLMSFIDTLYKSDSIEERDREKAKLELEYKASDKRLDNLVLKHEGDLTKVMQLFGTLSEQVTSAQLRIRKVKEHLKACKTLLHCKKDDLKKLWLEGLEYKYMIQLLEEIEKMTRVPKNLNLHLNKKQYLHATQLLVEAVSLGNSSLVGVDAVKELSQELEQKKDQLHFKLMYELKQHLYAKPSLQVLNIRRQGGSSTNRDGSFMHQHYHSSASAAIAVSMAASPLQRSIELRMSARQKPNVRRNLLEYDSDSDSDSDFNVVEDLNVTDPEGDSANFMAILIKSLALLDKVSFALDEIRTEMQTELHQIIQRTSYHIMDVAQLQQATGNANANANVNAEINKQTKQLLLLDLMQTLAEQFKQIGQAHMLALKHFARACPSRSSGASTSTSTLYDTRLYWNQVQVVLQQLLTDYLDVQNMNNNQAQLSDDNCTANPNDISGFFSRRKQQQGKKKNMFKFDGSSSALIMHNCKEANATHATRGNGNANKRRDKIFVCPPDHNNILYIFVPLMCFAEEIEQLLDLEHSTQCALHTFLSDYVNDKFLTRRHTDTLARIELSVRATDAWKSTVLLEDTTDYKPLLISTVNVEKLIRDWRKVLASLPFCGENIVKYACNALKNYKETCAAAYCGIVQPHSEDRRILSATWLKDDDISRFLKSLPNWQNLKAIQEFQARNARRRAVRREHTLEEESPEEVRQRNRREAEMLASNLSEDGVNASEILSDTALLKELAQLQESMEWFSVQMLQFASEFRQDPTLPAGAGAGAGAGTADQHPPIVSTAKLQQLTSVAQDFDELANTCLLLLHLEVRVQCFHYLLAPSEYNKETHEPDPKVLELSRVLANVDEAMTSSLHSRKCKYIFEGLGHLIAKILISSSQYMQAIDEAGIQRMCRNVFALQQTLTNITMTREVALDHARHYFELFFLTPEEILNGIMEKGPEFSELEYMNAFQLLHRSQKDSDGGGAGGAYMVTAHLERLSDILGEVGVTV